MSVRLLIRECLWPRDARTSSEIDADVREELQSHVQRLVDANLGAGLSEEAARQSALDQFGDLPRYAAECRRISLGRRLIVRRAVNVACLLLLAACAYLGWRTWQGERQARQLRADLSTAEAKLEDASLSHEEWVARLISLRDHMHTAFVVGPELTLLDPDEGLRIVREAWPSIKAMEVKTGLLKTFQFSKALPETHPRLFQVLHLGMTDEDEAVRAYAAAYLEEYAAENFLEHPERYDAWHRRHKHKTPAEVRRADVLSSSAP